MDTFDGLNAGRLDGQKLAVAPETQIDSLGGLVSRLQYAFLIGVLLVWLAWAAGWVVLAAIAAGLIGLAVVRVLEGTLDLNDITERFRSSSGPPKHR